MTQNTPETLKPLPCPFCGCSAEMMVRPEWRRQPQTYMVACQSGFGSDEPLCAGETSYPYPSREEAIAAWNKRPESPSGKCREEVEAFLLDLWTDMGEGNSKGRALDMIPKKTYERGREIVAALRAGKER